MTCWLGSPSDWNGGCECMDAEDLNYVTNAINELVAYPESELPE